MLLIRFCGHHCHGSCCYVYTCFLCCCKFHLHSFPLSPCQTTNQYIVIDQNADDNIAFHDHSLHSIITILSKLHLDRLESSVSHNHNLLPCRFVILQSVTMYSALPLYNQWLCSKFHTKQHHDHHHFGVTDRF